MAAAMDLVALLAIFSHGRCRFTPRARWPWRGKCGREHHWLVPYINGEPYSEKVPLLFWLIHAGWFVFGVNDVWPRVLEVIFGGAQLVLLSVLARTAVSRTALGRQGGAVDAAGAGYAFLFGLQIMYEVLLADLRAGRPAMPDAQSRSRRTALVVVRAAALAPAC